MLDFVPYVLNKANFVGVVFMPLEPILDFGLPCDVVSSSSSKSIIMFFEHIGTIGMVSSSSFHLLGMLELNSSTSLAMKLLADTS